MMLRAAESNSRVDIGDKVPGLVLTFWCSFCHSCRHVEEDLDQLAKEYKGKAAVFALDASAGETAEAVAQFAREKGLTLPILLNSDGSVADLFGTKVTTVVSAGCSVKLLTAPFADVVDDHGARGAPHPLRD